MSFSITTQGSTATVYLSENNLSEAFSGRYAWQVDPIVGNKIILAPIINPETYSFFAASGRVHDTKSQSG